jgi:hypothetical protein
MTGPTSGAPVRPSDVEEAVEAALARMGARLRRAAAQAIGNITLVPVSWDTEDEDTDALWSSGTTITIPADGIWAINFSVIMATATLGQATRAFLDLAFTSAVTGAPTNVRNGIPAGETRAVIGATVRLDEGDTFTAGIFHTNGASQNLTTGFLSVFRVGR